MKIIWQSLMSKKKYRQLKENIRIMTNQRSDTKKMSLIEKAKKQALTKLLSAMKLLITVSNHKYKMKSYYLKCRENTKS